MSKKITMTETKLGSPNGYEVNTYEKGVTYDVPDDLADSFIGAKVATLVEEKPTGKKSKE